MKMILHEQIIHGAVRDIRLSEPVIFADREAQGRSGHVGHALTEYAPGKVMAFAANTSAHRLGGHAAFGWVEYSTSEDGGETFGAPRRLECSWKAFLDGLMTYSVEKAVTLPDGTVAAVCLRNTTDAVASCEPWHTPVVIRSADGGKTWTEPTELCPYEGRVYDMLVKDGIIYALELCNDARVTFLANKPEHLYRLFVSTDGGVTFSERSVIPFPETLGRAYGNLIFTPAGELICYAYNGNDEQHMDFIRSADNGKTWFGAGSSFVAHSIRNPQVGLLDGQYILHGRAGENGAGAGSFVLYTSADGFTWDGGTVLVSGRRACFYSNNLTLTGPDGHQRMLVQYSENVRGPSETWTGQVNIMHLFIESV